MESKVNRKSKQEWFDNYYYPVLPRYNKNGTFIENNYPNNNMPFPDGGIITNKNDTDNSLLLHIGNTTIDRGVLDDLSENTNYGFYISDYKPNISKKTGELKRTRDSMRAKTDPGTNDGAF